MLVFSLQLALIIPITVQALQILLLLLRRANNLPMSPPIIIQTVLQTVKYLLFTIPQQVAQKPLPTLSPTLPEQICLRLLPSSLTQVMTFNWTNDNSRVSIEHNDESKRDVPLTKTTPDNWADYDTVFIGYPIWWGIAAWPVNNFVEGNDFTGKTVIPFCTSSSSGLGQSGDLLADMAGTGNWQDGERFSSGASSSKVESWVNGLDLK